MGFGSFTVRPPKVTLRSHGRRTGVQLLLILGFPKIHVPLQSKWSKYFIPMLTGPIVEGDGVLPWFDDTLKAQVSISYNEHLPNVLGFLVAEEL